LTIGGWLVWACEWDRILACRHDRYPSGRKNENRNRSARQKRLRGLRALSPRPPLRDFTKEMGLFSGTARGLRPGVPEGQKRKPNPPAQTNRCGREYQPISSEPAPSHRPWASARARPLADNR